MKLAIAQSSPFIFLSTIIFFCCVLLLWSENSQFTWQHDAYFYLSFFFFDLFRFNTSKNVSESKIYSRYCVKSSQMNCRTFHYISTIEFNKFYGRCDQKRINVLCIFFASVSTLHINPDCRNYSYFIWLLRFWITELCESVV